MKKQSLRPPHVIEPNAVYNLDQAAAETGIARSTLQFAARRGDLVANRPGKEYIIFGNDLAAWIRKPRTVKSTPSGHATSSTTVASDPT